MNLQRTKILDSRCKDFTEVRSTFFIYQLASVYTSHRFNSPCVLR